MIKFTYEFVKKSFENEGYILLSKTYKNNKIKLDYICPNKHKHSITFGNWRLGKRCPYCIGLVKKTIEEIKSSFKNDGYILLSKKYVNAHSKLDYICPNGHKHSITWDSWQQGVRCPYCVGLGKPTIEFIREEFAKEDYVLLTKKYINNHTKLNYICPKGHKHFITWSNWNHPKKYRCPTCANINKGGDNNCSWKGGVTKLKLPLYDTYASQLNFAEEVRLFIDEKGLRLLEVKCSKCDRWFIPKRTVVTNRIKALNSYDGKECRFYCSQECKDNCEVYKKQARFYLVIDKLKDINKPYTDAELRVWSQEVLKRANYKCEICGGKAEHAHHIQPKKLEPGLSLDPSNGLAVCNKCHFKYGHQNECSAINIAKIVCK